MGTFLGSNTGQHKERKGARIFTLVVKYTLNIKTSQRTFDDNSETDDSSANLQCCSWQGRLGLNCEEGNNNLRRFRSRRILEAVSTF